MEKYENLGIVGEGSYGLVMKCRHRETGQLVAIKKFLETEDDVVVRKMAVREIRMLKRLRHDNLVNLLDVFRRKRRFYLVFEFLDHTLLDELEATNCGLGERRSKEHIFQVVRGVDFCHSHNIIHRDIKPENVLVSSSGVIKLCDFGFARPLSSDEIYTDYVATRWYRAPELLVVDTFYGKEVDIWAIGCLFAEMMSGDPLFPGDSDIDQLYQIIRVMGKLSGRHQHLVARNPALKTLRRDPDEGKSLAKIFPSWSLTALDFLGNCLKMDPQLRPTTSELLHHLLFIKDNFTETFLAELRHKILHEFQGNPLLRKCQGSAPRRSEGQRRSSIIDPSTRWRLIQGEESRRPSIEVSRFLDSSKSKQNEPMDVSLDTENEALSPGVLRPYITNVSFNDKTTPWTTCNDKPSTIRTKLSRKPDRLDPLVIGKASPPPMWLSKRNTSNWKNNSKLMGSDFSLPNVPGATTSPKKVAKKKFSNAGLKDIELFLSPRTFHFQTPSATSRSRFNPN